MPLLAPEQAYFVRENLKLRLLSARIALLQRDQVTYRADIKAARDWLNRYFDTRSKAVTNVLASLRELGESPVNIDVPDISDSVEAVRNYKIARDETDAGGRRDCRAGHQDPHPRGARADEGAALAAGACRAGGRPDRGLALFERIRPRSGCHPIGPSFP